MTVLLLTDLEGVAGVDRIPDLLHGQPGHGRAQWLLLDEIAAACAGLREGPLAPTPILIADTHHGGPAPTVPAFPLPPGTTLARTPGLLDPTFLDGIDALACLGLHAAATGFAPHTVDLACHWESDRRPV
ncbi:MAG TPA: M55 family metallopeptidase, partial [Polyangia bacterium]|nr:M55 family metallopeptidase [Polyangia bacterium]